MKPSKLTIVFAFQSLKSNKDLLRIANWVEDISKQLEHDDVRFKRILHSTLVDYKMKTLSKFKRRCRISVRNKLFDKVGVISVQFRVIQSHFSVFDFI